MTRQDDSAGAAALIGVDLGGTRIRAIAADPGGRVLHRISNRHTARGYATVLSLVERAVTECRQAIRPRPVRGVGVAVAWLSADRQELLAAANLGVAGVPLRRDLERQLRLPVVLENDGNAAALAEARAGGGQHARMLVMLTIGTSVGGGIVAGGSLLTGAAGLPGELGHIPAERDGPPCPCGGRGCLEAYASGTAVARLAAGASVLAPRDTGGVLTAEDVVAAARAGGQKAAGVLQRAGAAIGRTVAGLIPVLSPDLVLIGGGLATGATDLLLIPARRALAAAAPLSDVRPVPPMLIATCGPDAGALGATYLPGLITTDA